MIRQVRCKFLSTFPGHPSLLIRRCHISNGVEETDLVLFVNWRFIHKSLIENSPSKNSQINVEWSSSLIVVRRQFLLRCQPIVELISPRDRLVDRSVRCTVEFVALVDPQHPSTSHTIDTESTRRHRRSIVSSRLTCRSFSSSTRWACCSRARHSERCILSGSSRWSSSTSCTMTRASASLITSSRAAIELADGDEHGVDTRLNHSIDECRTAENGERLLMN